MTIDISNLSPEKRAFLKANPDLLKSLEKALPKQVANFELQREKLIQGKAKWQQDIEKATGLLTKYMQDPILREIEQKLLRVDALNTKLVCPSCGENDRGNKMNGKPWCFKCNVTLVPKGEVANWQKLPKIKTLRRSFKDDVDCLIRLNNKGDT